MAKKNYTIHVVNPADNPRGYPFSGPVRKTRAGPRVVYRPRVKGQKKRRRVKLEVEQADALAQVLADDMTARRQLIAELYAGASARGTLAAVARKSKRRPKRRRRKKNPVVLGIRKKRRGNPEIISRTGSDAILPLGMLAQEVAPAILAEMVGSALARRFGAAWGTGIFTGSADSSYAGQRWSMSNYAIMIGQGYLVAQLMKRSGRSGMAHAYYRGAWEAAVRRFLWTEVLAQSSWAVSTFGSPVGSVQDDQYGSRWYQTPTGWSAMMGGDDFGDSLVTESALGDALVTESALGHALPGADPIDARGAAYRGDGYANPYHSSYSYQ